MARSGEPGGPRRAGPIFSPRAREDRRARRLRSGAPYLVPTVLALAAAVALWAAWGRLGAIDLSVAAASPETQVKTALAHQDRAHLADVYGFKSGGTAELYPVRFADVQVSVAPDRKSARVLAVVEAEGSATWRDERATISYVGREVFGMTPCSIALWCGDGRQFSMLRGVLMTLFRREDAFNGRDAEAYARIVSDDYAEPGGKAALLGRLRSDLGAGPPLRVRILGWQIRVERDRAVAGEDYEIRADGRAPERLRARYTLARDGERWLIAGGL